MKRKTLMGLVVILTGATIFTSIQSCGDASTSSSTETDTTSIQSTVTKTTEVDSTTTKVDSPTLDSGSILQTTPPSGNTQNGTIKKAN